MRPSRPSRVSLPGGACGVSHFPCLIFWGASLFQMRGHRGGFLGALYNPPLLPTPEASLSPLKSAAHRTGDMPGERMRPWTRVRSGRDRSRFQPSASALLFVCAGVDTAGPSLGSVLWRRWGSLVQAFPVYPPSPPWVPHLWGKGGGGEDGTLPAHSFPPRILLGGRGGPLSSHACRMPDLRPDWTAPLQPASGGVSVALAWDRS